jgi:apolipoprotein N-acyltransferase
VLVSALVYGHMRTGVASESAKGDAPRAARIALIQGNSLAEWKYDPSREQQIMDEYFSLSQRAVESAKQHGDGRPLDLVVWPETMFRTPIITFDAAYEPPADAPRTPEEIASYGPTALAALARRLDTPVLVGVERMHQPAQTADGSERPPLRYNSAALVDRSGKIVGTYDKVHRVVFGEFIPFSKWLPWLHTLAPIAGRIDAGDGPVVLESDGRHYAPNICYETVVPHVIRRHARTTAADGRAPDVLVNVTNDAWYWGSSELDMHLACGVFRAIETRTPLVIAANGGISAWIDQHGRIRAQSPRQTPDVIIADVERFSQRSLYMEFGDWFAGLCLVCCFLFAVIGWWGRRQMKVESALPPTPNSRID